MMYVDGGLYISYSTIQSFVFAFGPAGANVTGTALALTAAYFGSLKAALAVGVTAFFSWFNAMPGIGQVLFVYAAANALLLAGYLVSAYFQKKGADINVDWSWFIPYVKIKVR